MQKVLGTAKEKDSSKSTKRLFPSNRWLFIDNEIKNETISGFGKAKGVTLTLIHLHVLFLIPGEPANFILFVQN